MSTDLIFHVVSRRKWPSLIENGEYKPDHFSETQTIECVTAGYLNAYLNDAYKSHRNLFLLVIDSARLQKRVSIPEDATVLNLDFPVNQDAILDKIRIDASKEDGTFDLEFTEFQ
ncbi:MAG: DUF952 domain-containing protein [Balneolaceae bacterium]